MTQSKIQKIHPRQKYQAKQDIVVLCLLPILASIITLAFDINMITSTVLFFGPSALYLSLKTPHAVKRASLFAVIVTFGCGIIDYFAGVDKSWYTYTIFPFRIFGHITIENLLWAFLLIYLIVIFYEHFFDKGKHKVIGSNLKYLSVSLCALGLAIASLHWLIPESLHYFYFKAGVILLLLPVILLIVAFPKYIAILLKTTPYFFALGLLVEVTSIYKGYWYYPGQHFIGYITIDTLSFPLEEAIFWMLLFAAAMVTYFEFFDDNRARLPERLLRKLKLFKS